MGMTYRRIQIMSRGFHHCCIVRLIPGLQINTSLTTFLSLKIPNCLKLLQGDRLFI